MEFFGNRKPFLRGVGAVVVFLVAGGLWILRPQGGLDTNKQGGIGERSKAVPPQTYIINHQDLPENASPALIDRGGIELYKTETITCNGKNYIVDVILQKGQGYFNEIYKDSRAPANLLVRDGESKYSPGSIQVLAVPKESCDRIYFTRFSPETDSVARGIYEWRVGENTIREIVGRNEFNHTFLPYPHDGKGVISPNGNRALATYRAKEDLILEGSCDLRILRLYYLAENRNEILLQLSENEVLESGFDDELGFCVEVNFGWLDQSTIYYDVYDATAKDEGRYFLYPLLERRTLKIE